VINSLGFVIESLVSVLLLITICYCTILNKRLRRLRADEHSLKATISELITATEIAERAIAGLKLTVRECDRTLGERLRSAERFSADIERQIDIGEAILNRLGRIVAATRSDEETAPKPPPDTKAVVAAAQAFAERARSRVNGRAA
jgi:chromosome segregation ATPase